MNKYLPVFCCLVLLSCVHPTSALAAGRTLDGVASVDAIWYEHTRQPIFKIVEWDGKFETAYPVDKRGQVRVTFESDRTGGDGSIPSVTEYWDVVLNHAWADQMVRTMLTSSPWSPTYPNGVPDPKNPPRDYKITLDGWVHSAHGGKFTMRVKVNQWSGLTVPVTCAASSSNVAIGPIPNDAIASSTAPVRLRCDGEAQYKLTVGSVNGSDLIQYANGGRVRMSFDEGVGTNVVSGHADKNRPVDVTIRATTVPGTALPGKYTASAVISVEIL
ncbi:hypothetical protein [Serratia nematodiphila]|uniref:hypothetical protein n=1 Tax=Serratia nematodiphila TaxID=458197 RepID=UPI0010841213|nr:hypothetical protein [Serratia nematodiphila]UTO02333.1 hypothetical protein NLX84_04455 [Serratia nematodiphila]